MHSDGRPRMPPGYGLGPGDGLLSWDELTARLAAARNYWIATATSDGRPHVTPVWALWHEECLWFGTDRASRKARNLLANPRVAVHLESGDDVLILNGAASLEDPGLCAGLDGAYQAKYGTKLSEAPGDLALFRVRFVSALAWREQDFPKSATRFRR